MAASKRPYMRLAHIRDELAWMLPAGAGKTLTAFTDDILLQRAIERGLLIIGEAVNALPAELIARYPEVNWHQARGMGHFLRHEYDKVMPDIIWHTWTVVLPTLEPVILRMLAEQENQ